MSPWVYAEETGYNIPTFADNVYLQHSDRKLAVFWGHGEESWHIDNENDVEKYIDMMGDTTSKFYIIPAK